MKKILLSLSMIAVVGVVVAGATGAFFSDTETSTGNTFTAGAIDLKVDSEQHYNGHECIANTQNTDGVGGSIPDFVWSTGTNPYPVAGTACGGTWGQTAGLDIVSEQFFNFGDIKPGDEGENTISLHVINNDAYVCATVSNLTSLDNLETEPEALVDNSTSDTEGELDNEMLWTIWRDDGDNVQEVDTDADTTVDETTLLSGNPTNGWLAVYDSTTSTGPLLGGNTGYLGVSWTLPGTSGNETQTDSLTGDISFSVVQSRNNLGYTCNPLDQENSGTPT